MQSLSAAGGKHARAHELRCGGRDNDAARAAEGKLQAKSSTTWLIVGGVVVLVLVLAAVASAQPTAGPPDGAFD